MNKHTKMLKRSRYLRKNSTNAENELWYYLKGRQFNGYKFKRQKIIEKYIVDFVCEWKKLIIELDGGQHTETQRYDHKRTAFLELKGYRVLRFWNNEVIFEINTVLDVILAELNDRFC